MTETLKPQDFDWHLLDSSEASDWLEKHSLLLIPDEKFPQARRGGEIYRFTSLIVGKREGRIDFAALRATLFEKQTGQTKRGEYVVCRPLGTIIVPVMSETKSIIKPEIMLGTGEELGLYSIIRALLDRQTLERARLN